MSADFAASLKALTIADKKCECVVEGHDQSGASLAESDDDSVECAAVATPVRSGCALGPRTSECGVVCIGCRLNVDSPAHLEPDGITLTSQGRECVAESTCTAIVDALIRADHPWRRFCRGVGRHPLEGVPRPRHIELD